MALNTNQLPFQSASRLIAALKNKEISSLELLEYSISRIEQLDKEINAVILKDYDRARQTAKLADAALAKGEYRPLLGLPMTVKESFNIAGLPTSWGNVSFKHWMPKHDAVAVQRLKSAGAVILGKTNIPCMLGDWQTYNEIYGTTHNPWNLNLTPGGSSGGSAAALTMGYISLELGSDLAGSLRVPAHFCGITAHKPSKNLIPLRGASPPQTPESTRKIDFVVAGPMARTTQDLMLGLKVLAGPDEWSDGMGYKLTLPPSKQNKLNDFRVLLLTEHPLYPTDKEITHLYLDLFKKLQQQGVNISHSHPNLSDLSEISRLYALLLGAWFSEVMTKESYEQACIKIKTLDVHERSLANQFLRGLTLSHRDWLLAIRERDKLTRQWNKLYEDFDIILSPVMPTPAFPHDHSENPEQRRFLINGVEVPYAHQYIWVCIANLFGLPATCVPVGFTSEKLPVGIQIIGKYLHDCTTLKFGELLEGITGGFVPPFSCKSMMA